MLSLYQCLYILYPPNYVSSTVNLMFLLPKPLDWILQKKKVRHNYRPALLFLHFFVSLYVDKIVHVASGLKSKANQCDLNLYSLMTSLVAKRSPANILANTLLMSLRS